MTHLSKGTVRIELFQGLRVRRGEVCIEHFDGRRAASLLAYLAYFAHRRHPREELIEMLWPDEDVEATRSRFRQVLTSLRHVLNEPDATHPDLLIADRTLVSLQRESVSTDVAEFEALLKAAEQTDNLRLRITGLRKATALYTGELLPGYYEEWVTSERRRLNHAHRSALRMLAEALADTDDAAAACAYARQAIDLDPLDEEAVAIGIRVFRNTGRTVEALRLFRELEQRLWTEMRVLPSPHLQALLTAAPSVSSAPSERPQTDRLSNVPLESVPREASAFESGAASLTEDLTPFFGRRLEIDLLTEQLPPIIAGQDPGARLVTLIGPGGSGKTRLALEVARRLVSVYRGAVWFVSLADVTEPDRIVPEIVGTMYRTDSDHLDPEARLDALLGHRPALLVLDNFEQLAERGASVVRALLLHAPTLRCLVTSRHALDLAGERRVEVLPLPVPDAEDAIGPATASPSVRLFVDRARNVAANFELTAENVPSVVALCRHLEGIPLAIELAASWVALLDPADLLARLGDRFGLLVSSRQDIAPRHRSLRATIEWSYTLLDPEVQSVFAQLTVFHEGWTLQAAEAVCLIGTMAAAQPLAQIALTALAKLQQVSLIRTEVGAGPVRLRMLETLREFAGEQLDAVHRKKLRERHARHYLALAEGASSELTGPIQSRYYDELHRDAANLRAAMLWCLEPDGDIEVGLRLVGSLWRYWDMRGPTGEAAEWIETLVGFSGQVSVPIRARALWAAGSFALTQYRHADAEPWLVESVRLYAVAGDEVGRGRALCALAAAVRDRGAADHARALFQEAQALLRANNDLFGTALALGGLGVIAGRAGDMVASHSLLEQAGALYRVCGHRKGIAWCHYERAIMARFQGNTALQLALVQEGLPISRVLNDGRSIIFALFHIASCRQKRGELTEAQAAGEEAIRVARTHGRVVSEVAFLIWLGDMAVDRLDYAVGWDYYEQALTRGIITQSSLEILMALTRCAHLAFAIQRIEEAVCLFGAASTLPELEFTEIPNPPHYVCPEALPRLRQEMEPALFAQNWSRGQHLTPEEAIGFVQEIKQARKRL